MTASNQVDIPDFAATLDAMAPATVAAKPAFKVTINFYRAPAFSTTVMAADKTAAEAIALKFARESGWTETIRGRVQSVAA